MPIPQLIIFLTNFHYFANFFFEGLKNGKKCAFKSEIIILLLSPKKKLNGEKQLTYM